MLQKRAWIWSKLIFDGNRLEQPDGVSLKFAKAINHHDYNLLREAVRASGGNNKAKVNEMLFVSGKVIGERKGPQGEIIPGDPDISIDVELVKAYFRNTHLNDI